jgi:hypothetical protein
MATDFAAEAPIPLLEHYLTPSGMAAARAALTVRYPWFLNVSDTDRFDKIRVQGLKPFDPGCAPPDLALKHLGDRAREILCLRPLSTFDTTPKRGNPRFVLAVAGAHLPDLIGLDWSYDGTWTLPDIIKGDTPDMPDDQIFCEVVRRRGSVVSYSGIAVPPLRVRSTGLPEGDPESWPALTSVDRSDLHVF